MGRRRHRLIERRKSLGLSQEGLAEIAGVDVATVARWERGETTPQPLHRKRLAEALNVTVEEVSGLLAEAGGLPASTHPRQRAAGAIETTDQLPLTGLLARQRADTEHDLRPPVLLPANEGNFAIQAEILIRHYLALEAEVGGDRLYASLAGQVQQLASAMNEHAHPRLLSAFAQLCQMTGWLAMDANRHGAARQYLTTTVLAAHQADEPALAASALAYMSLQETYRNHPSRALALARTAHDVAAGSGTPLARTMLATRLARAQARIGSRNDALTAVGQAEEAFTGANDAAESEPLWLSYVDQREVHAQKGACYLDLGMHREAASALTEALRLLDQHTPTHLRDRVHYLCRLAKAHLGAGELDPACAAAHEALDHGWALGSSRVVERLGELHHDLAPYAGQHAVRAFRDRFAGFIRDR